MERVPPRQIISAAGPGNNDGINHLLVAEDISMYGDLKGTSDKFRIRIWEEEDGTELTVYDNQMAEAMDADATTVLGGRSIIIHK